MLGLSQGDVSSSVGNETAPPTYTEGPRGQHDEVRPLEALRSAIDQAQGEGRYRNRKSGCDTDIYVCIYVHICRNTGANLARSSPRRLESLRGTIRVNDWI